MFEEVTTQLENRAQQALNRAQETVKGRTESAITETTNSSLNFVRDRPSEMVPDTAKSLLKGGSTPAKRLPAEKLPALPSLDFDPFLE